MASKENNVYGYTLKDKHGRVVYIGQTNNPRARNAEHQLEGKEFLELKTERRGMTEAQADKWEREWLSEYRRRHGGRNPRYNRTLDGQPDGVRYKGSKAKSHKTQPSKGAKNRNTNRSSQGSKFKPIKGKRNNSSNRSKRRPDSRTSFRNNRNWHPGLG